MKTNADKLIKKYALNWEYIKSLTDMTDPERAVLQWNEGIRYAKEHFYNNEETVSMITRSSQYWMWWRNQWNLRENEFVNKISMDDDGNPWYKYAEGIFVLFEKSAALEYYHNIHTKELNVYPSKSILDEAYKDMMHDHVKKEVKK